MKISTEVSSALYREDLFEDIKEMAKTARRLANMFENA